MSSPTKLSDTEIALVIEGDRKEIDRLVLERLNHIITALSDFVEKEFRDHATEEDRRLDKIEVVVKELGDPEAARARVRWIESQIKGQEARTAMMVKVRDSVLIWAAIAFVGYMAYAGWTAVVHDIREAMGK